MKIVAKAKLGGAQWWRFRNVFRINRVECSSEASPFVNLTGSSIITWPEGGNDLKGKGVRQLKDTIGARTMPLLVAGAIIILVVNIIIITRLSGPAYHYEQPVAVSDGVSLPN